MNVRIVKVNGARVCTGITAAATQAHLEHYLLLLQLLDRYAHYCYPLTLCGVFIALHLFDFNSQHASESYLPFSSELADLYSNKILV